MPFSSQFSLSLELTNLIPIPRRITDRVSAGVSELLTAIVRSGSDPETERLTMEVFGRNTIERGMERTFREVTQFSTKRTVLQQSLDLVLDAGAGPTLQRALESPEYLATVIQLSMLSWCHHNDRLAEALAGLMRRRMEGAPPEFQLVQSYPEKNGLMRFITVCEEQSSTFPWQRFFDSVEAKVGLHSPEPRPRHYREWRCLDVRVFQACLDMLTAVQASPEQRRLRIRCQEGIVTLVVWAHCLLGLGVAVSGSPFGTVHFGGEPTVFVHIGDRNTKTEVCLLDSAEDILLLVDATDATDARSLFGRWRFAAKGYGTSMLRCSFITDPVRIADMVHVVAALALCISLHLDERQQSPCRERRNMNSAINFLFDDVDIDEGQIQEYFAQYSRKPINDRLPVPESLRNGFKWSYLVGQACRLALSVLALSCVVQLESCEEWRLGSMYSINQSRLGKSIGEWDGNTKLPFEHDTCYELVCCVMEVPFHRVEQSFLCSAGGWSIWMSSFGDIDPFAISPGVLFVQPGVPTSRLTGERRHQLMDSYQGGTPFSWQCQEKSGETTWPRCETPERFCLRSFTGKDYADSDIFFVDVSFGTEFPYSGYREMHQKRSEAVGLRHCSHNPNSTIALPEDTATGAVIYGHGVDESLPRVCISLVRGSVGGRWLTILSSEEDRRIALTMDDVCLECAIDQTLKLGGNWFIVC